MSTVLPPKAKHVKREELQRAREQQPVDLIPENVPNVVVQLRASDTGNQLGGELHIPGNATAKQLDQLVNKLLGTVRLCRLCHCGIQC
jgi:ribosome assembly protein 4